MALAYSTKYHESKLSIKDRYRE